MFKKKNLLAALLVASTAILGLQDSAKAQNYLTSLFIEQAIDDLNSNLPMKIDDDIRWDSSSLHLGEIVVLNYTLTNFSSPIPMNGQDIRAFKNELLSSACTKDLAFIYENNMSIENSFSDKYGRLIGRVKFTPSDCGY